MKKYLIILLLVLSTSLAFAQEDGTVSSITKEPLFKVSFNEGVSFGQITRIEKFDDRSNFVRENFLVGGFFNVKTDDLWIFDLMVQVDAFYPFYNTFNGMRQYPKQVLLYAVDGYLGAVYSFNYIKYLPIDISFGMHYMYQLTDEYHMSYVGIATLNTIEFPLTERWSIINNYFFSFDDANLGTNKGIQKFNGSYQYHIDLGVRYSRKVTNPYHYINPKPKASAITEE